MLLEDVTGKVAVVTGANSGVGRSVARKLAQTGISVVLADIADAQDLARTIADESKVAAVPCVVDVANAASVEQMFKLVGSRFGRLDYLVNCAGVDRVNTIVDASVEEWDWIVGVNLKAVFLCCRLAIPLMKHTGGGAIVNIGSAFVMRGHPKSAIYSATKAGVHQLTKCMAVDHIEEGIRINCVAPGPIDTPMLQKEISEHANPEEMEKTMIKNLPIKRVASAEEIADAACFLLSKYGAYMVGSALVVDGGESL